LKWPDFYPANCPPAEAESASGTVYRLVNHDPAQEEDFKTPFEENPRRFKYTPGIKNCALSVQTDIQDSEQLKKAMMKMVPRFKNSQIAKGELNPTLGLIQHTPSSKYRSHHSWWVPIGAEPWVVFKIISG
jgi:hypothetical protein